MKCRKKRRDEDVTATFFEENIVNEVANCPKIE